MNQPTLPYDSDLAGQRARDEGMARVEFATERRIPRWGDMALDVLRDVAFNAEEFSADDVHDAAARLGLPEPHDKRAWGPVMMRAVRTGLCRKSGRYRNSTRANVHAMPLPIYTSMVWRGGEW